MSFLNKIIDKAKNHKNEEERLNSSNYLPKIPENGVAISQPTISGNLNTHKTKDKHSHSNFFLGSSKMNRLIG